VNEVLAESPCTAWMEAKTSLNSEVLYFLSPYNKQRSRPMLIDLENAPESGAIVSNVVSITP